ncbi:hypothetical protein DCAR_0312735 [Daucus carota subsp. sativus]|uniref:Surfeit locus protein 2 n=1 Tax=Daucus carota subsp. sativus TaxID=79200 RepID=A0A166B920_DAUCS|nr:PREDICTED: uncharacterized protein LOC108215099 isoform X1 [Daucus carota subsp. sativus]WOG93451.1 hypothetical protein DCAR_0312735 [Daucus carota subsp. sativus]
MGKKKQKAQENGSNNNDDAKNELVEKEGENLLGAPKFKKLENGRFKCVETGHELPAHAKDSYAQTKHCRLGLIDSFLRRNKPPLNMFQQDPVSSSKLTCKLTGLTVNKSEEHIWKHINGKRFLNMLEKKEAEKEAPNGTGEGPSEEKTDANKTEDGSTKKNKKKEKKKKKKKNMSKQMEETEENANVSDVKNPSGEGDSLEEVDFWIPPSGDRWDFDDGGQRYGSDSGPETDDSSGTDGADEENGSDMEELSKKEKRMPVESNIENCMPRKKKNKTKSTSQDN